jgi:hypothetical protein
MIMDNPHRSILKIPTESSTSSALEKIKHDVFSLFSGYIQNINPQRVLESVGSAAGSKMAHEGFLALFDFSSILSRPVYHSLKFSFSWLGKKIVCGLNSNESKSTPDLHRPSEELMITEEEFVLIEEGDEGVNKVTHEKMTTSEFAYHLRDACKDYVLTVKPIDVVNIAGGSIGAGVAGLTFALFIGPPGLIGMPVLLLTEVMAKGFGEYLAGKGARKIMGNRSDLPIVMQALQHVPDSVLAAEKVSSIDQEQQVDYLTPEQNVNLLYYYDLKLKAEGEVSPDLTQFIQDNYPVKNNLSPNT